MGQGTRGASRLHSKNALTRVLALALPVAGLYALFLFANRDYNIKNPSHPAPISSGASRDHDWGLHSLMHHSNGQNGALQADQQSSMSRIPSQPVKQTKPHPSCVTQNKVASSFLMIFMGHSGSTAIISELRAHSKMLIGAGEPIDHFEYAKNSSLALEYTRNFFMKGRKEGKVAGFKMRPWHIRQNPDAWIALTKEFGTRIIWQYRHNILKQAVGEYTFRYLKDESAVEGLKSRDELKKRCSTGAGCRFKITDFPFFHLMLKDSLHSDLAITRGVHVLVNGSTCVHEMPYEDYLYDRETAMRNLQEFLGVEYQETTPSRFKATSDSLCEVIENWDELCENFYGCHVWRHMFEDRQNRCMCKFSSGPVHYCDTVFDNEANDTPRRAETD